MECKENYSENKVYINDLIYCEDNLKYIDTYLGSERFIGEEAIWIDNNPFWAMNYSGRIMDEAFLDLIENLI